MNAEGPGLTTNDQKVWILRVVARRAHVATTASFVLHVCRVHTHAEAPRWSVVPRVVEMKSIWCLLTRDKLLPRSLTLRYVAT